MMCIVVVILCVLLPGCKEHSYAATETGLCIYIHHCI
uniref:Uncharacterized protein n=1 Tax=Arundo donax TaxID=35708 RepID=A0A0A9H536_ARUDO